MLRREGRAAFRVSQPGYKWGSGKILTSTRCPNFSTSTESTAVKKEEMVSYEGHSSRTRVTSTLWEKRMKAQQLQLQEFLRSKSEASAQRVEPTRQVGTEAPSFLLNKKPSESFVELSLPFGCDKALREEYINFYGQLRFDKLLEDLDATAGNIAHAHADDNNPCTRPLNIVTASVDRIDLLDKIHPDRDMLLRGSVSYVGKSSMEVKVDVAAQNPETGVFEPSILSTFTMVATFEGKAAPVNRLVPETEEEKLAFTLGEENQRYRKEWSKASLNVTPPTPEEQRVVHEIFMEREQKKRVQQQGVSLAANVQNGNNRKEINMGEAHLHSVVVCQPQERNMNNKIFGGYLMRKAAELAWANAHIFSGSRPWFLGLDDVSFHRPVSIGSIITFDSAVVYSEPQSLKVKVIVQVLNPADGSKEKTNTLFFTFTCPEHGAIPRVIPNTYAEAMDYLNGQRRHTRAKAVATSLGSKLLKFY